VACATNSKRTPLAPDAFDPAWAKAEAMTLEEAIVCTLQVDATSKNVTGVTRIRRGPDDVL
jgi:hypothetical protein